MSSKRKKRRRSCESKIRHKDENAAYAALRNTVKGDVFYVHLSAYRCKFCGGWHIGRMSKRQRQSRRDRIRAAHGAMRARRGY